jgi:hypothetical protein
MLTLSLIYLKPRSTYSQKDTGHIKRIAGALIISDYMVTFPAHRKIVEDSSNGLNKCSYTTGVWAYEAMPGE